MNLQTDIDGIRAKVATLEAARDRSTSDDIKAEIQAEIDNWILIHAHVLLSTRFASPEKTQAEIAPENPVAEPHGAFLRDILITKRSIVIAFTLGIVVGVIALWLFIKG